MKRVFTLFLGVIMASMALAQPSGYYNAAEGKSGSSLKSALNNIIDGHTEISYSACWDALKVTDRDPSNSSNVIGLYSGFSMNAAAQYDGGAGWNREHVWAKSRGDFGTSKGAGTDLHHLRAEDVSTNSARNNRHFGTGNQFYTDATGNYSGPTQSKTNTSSWVWEPRDAVKGDVARMMFYMAVRYEGEGGEVDLELNNTVTGNTDKTPFHASLDLLLQWHEQDPVDQTERNRNDAIYGYQNNRNPFIDRPEFVDYIWGNGTPGNGGGGNPSDNVSFTLVTDNYPAETAWTLKNSSGSTVASGSNYSNTNATYTTSYNLPNGTYTFTITDSYGDGICCSQGNGSFTWKEGTTTVASGGNFSSSQTKTFTIGGSSGGGSTSADITVTLRTDNYPAETTWQIRNSAGQTVGGGGPYTNANTTYNKTYALPTGSYTFVINDGYGDGICCSYGNGSYTVSNGGNSLLSGGSFGSSESKGFTVAASRGSLTAAAANGAVVTTTPVEVELLAYPNPAQDEVTLSLPVKEPGEVFLQVINLQGQLMDNTTVEALGHRAEWNLNVGTWKAGLYILKATDARGNTFQTTLKVK